MPTKTEHVQQAEHNRQFWSTLNVASTPFVDWVVTGIFYEAVHWVEVFLATKSSHSLGHFDRNRALQMFREMYPIRNDFFALKNDSENARYICYRHSQRDIQSDLIPRVKAIEKHVRSLP